MNDKYNTRNINKVKRIIKEIIYNECMKNQINIKNFEVKPMTIVEYYINNIKNKKFKLYKISVPLKFDGLFYTNMVNSELIIFVKRRLIKTFSGLLFITYHEFRHFYQKNKFELWSPEGIIIYMEDLIKRFDYNHYLQNHDGYFSEIDANLYGVIKSLDYLKNNHINDEKEINHLNKLEDRYKKNYNNFDFSVLFEKFIKILRKNYKVIIIPDIFLIFINRDGTFKSINEIIGNPKLSDVNNYIAYSIISSKIFVDETNFDNLNKEENMLINDILYCKKTLKTSVDENSAYKVKSNE